LADQTGRIVCEASGSPLSGAGKRDDSNLKGWVTMLVPDESGVLERKLLAYAIETIRFLYTDDPHSERRSERTKDLPRSHS
jgi:hypothetical protein